EGFDFNDMLDQVNELRKNLKAGLLERNEKLMNSAKRHSDDQARMHHMSHHGSDGSEPSDRIQQEDYQYSYVAENVASGQKSVKEVMDSWINSTGHYKNLINPIFIHFGAAMNNNFWTQNFGAEQVIGYSV
ncbi:hypothetical protein L0F63_004915, partial [Massospora cicadina]